MCRSLRMYVCLAFLILCGVSLSQQVNLEVATRAMVEKEVRKFPVDSVVSQVDANSDGIISESEYIGFLRNSDFNQDGTLRMCELITTFRTSFGISQSVASFMAGLIDIDKSGEVDFAKEVDFMGHFDIDQDGKVVLAELRERLIASVRAAANLRYEAMNGPVRNDFQNPEISYERISMVVHGSDANGNGYFEFSDWVPMNKTNRCDHVDQHVNILYGGTRYFFNYYFNQQDTEGNEYLTDDFIYKLIRWGDREGDGRSSLNESIAEVQSLMRAARLQAGLNVANPWTCEGYNIHSPHGNTVLIGLDADLNQDGIVTAQEDHIMVLRATDDDDDFQIDQSELVDKLVRRYDVHTNVALEFFKQLDLNGDGSVDWASEQRYYMADLDRDGVTSVCEVMAACAGLLEVSYRATLEMNNSSIPPQANN